MRLTKRQKKKILSLFVAIVLIIMGYCTVNNETVATKYNVTLEKCIDGDTAIFNVNNESQKFRFLAIDTPESVHPKKKVQKYGKEASEYTCQALTKALKIEIEYDQNSDKKDKYNRQLAWIWVDNQLLQDELVKNGYAQVAYIYGNYKYTKILCDSEQKAKKEKIRIWNGNIKEGYCSTN